VQGSSLEGEVRSDSQKATALGSSRQQQHRADRRQHQQHELQTPRSNRCHLLSEKMAARHPSLSVSTSHACGRRSFPALAGVAERLLWHALDSLCCSNWSAWGLACCKFDPAHSGVCKEANLRVLYQQSVQQERRSRPAGSWQVACSILRRTTQEAG